MKPELREMRRDWRVRLLLLATWALYGYILHRTAAPWIHFAGALPVAFTALMLRPPYGAVSGLAVVGLFFFDFAFRWDPEIRRNYWEVGIFIAAYFPLVGYAVDWGAERYDEREIILSRLHSAFRATRDLHAARTVEEIWETTVDIAVESRGFRNATILVPDDDGVLEVRAQRCQDPTGVGPGSRLSPGKGISNRAYREKETVLVPDVRRDPDYVPGTLGTRAQISIPLLSEDEVLAVLTVEARDPDILEGPGEMMLVSLAELASEAHDKVRSLERSRRLAATDGLTGLWNRRVLRATLRSEMMRAHRFDRDLALVFLDIDCFKDLNDTHGHPAGDAVLRRLADVLVEASRDSDIVARYGGEEFAVILPETDHRGALVLAERMRSAVEETAFPVRDGDELHITVSLGVAVRLDADDSWHALLRRADEALYRAKDAGRNRVRGPGDST